jgi:hypothetical protein
LSSSEEQVGTWRKEVQILTIEKNAITAEAEKFKQQTMQLKEARTREFALIRENLLEKVRAEFDTVRIELKIANMQGESR